MWWFLLCLPAGRTVGLAALQRCCSALEFLREKAVRSLRRLVSCILFQSCNKQDMCWTTRSLSQLERRATSDELPHGFFPCGTIFLISPLGTCDRFYAISTTHSLKSSESNRQSSPIARPPVVPSAQHFHAIIASACYVSSHCAAYHATLSPITQPSIKKQIKLPSATVMSDFSFPWSKKKTPQELAKEAKRETKYVLLGVLPGILCLHTNKYLILLHIYC